MPTVSIIIPVYNNALSLPKLAGRLSEITQLKPEYTFEFIFVDDGSRDNSFPILCNLAERYPQIKIIKLTRNFGSNTAILAGMTYATGDCIGFIAADLQDPPEVLLDMIGHWELGCRVVFAYRKSRCGDPLSTRVFSMLFNWLFNKFVFSDISPQGIGFFLVDRQVMNVIIRSNEKNAHLIGLVLWTGFEYHIVEYDRLERVHGKSEWNIHKKIKFFIDAFTSFSYLPLRIASATGILLAISGMIYALFVIFLRIQNQVPVQGWSALMVVFLIASGIQLLILGVIGEYLWRNFDASRQRPLFIVDEIYPVSFSENNSD